MKKVVLLFAALWMSLAVAAKEPPMGNSGSGKKSKANKVLEELCTPATAQSDLNINNVRATILGGGDMWWDLNQARYEVPKGENKHSMFAGALWLGGVDEGNQLKLAAMTYRQRGNDFWTGPLSNDGTASVTKDICDKYDRHWPMLRSDVETHRAWLICKDDPDCDESVSFPGYSIPTSITNWPGNGAEGELPFMLAPFVDRDGDEVYDPNVDYPAYDLDKVFDCRKKEVDLIYGDQTLWWVYNDRGNVHTETQAGALGFEIRAQAFAFSTNDEVNNMTFYNYRILNKSTFRLTNTYFSTWFDADLGFADDDIIGCDIPRGLGYVYNGDNDDQGAFGYGLNPPAIALDFFQGPFADYYDGLDNDRDGCVDGVRDPKTGDCVAEDPTTGINERIIMSQFMYYNRSGSGSNLPEQTTDPENAAQFYNYMRALWKNGNPLVVESPSGPGNNGNGDGFTTDGTGLKTNYAYPGISFDTTGVTDPTSPVNWFESPGNLADKRGLHSAGPFSLAPGALNFITTGAVWARDQNSSDLFASVNRIIIADDKAQNLFDNCFQVLDGPTAPDMDIVELDREIIIVLSNSSTSNNFKLGYFEFDPTIPRAESALASARDSLEYFNYVFEGYQIFQLRGPNVSVGDIYDPAQARLVAQCDVKNGVTKIVNYYRDDLLETDVPQLMNLAFENNGVKHSFRILEDAFAEGDRRLINHREYYYTVVAYSHNNYAAYAQAPNGSEQKVPYLAGRLNNRVYQAIPHLTQPEQKGLVLGAQYGEGVELKRIEGLGNGNIDIEIIPEDLERIVREFKVPDFTYAKGRGPVDLKVVDPKIVPAGDYVLQFDGVSNQARWEIINANNGDVIAQSDTNIGFLSEQLIPELGMSLSLTNAVAPGGDEDGERNNGVLSGEVIYSNPQKPWLAFVPDGTGTDPFNWLLTGANNTPTAEPQITYRDYDGDPLNFFGRIANGGWGPYAYASHLFRGFNDNTLGLGPGMRHNEAVANRPSIANINSVNIVLTNDRSMWTRVPVFEMGEDNALTQGGRNKWDLRAAASWDLINGQMVRSTTDSGFSYFPGYAIDVETGTRLYLAFGENSWLVGQNGADMLFNPSSTIIQNPGNTITNGIVMGGQHFLYVFAPSVRISPQETRDLTYRGDNAADFPFNDYLDQWNTLNQIRFNRALMWVAIPVGVQGFEINPYVEPMESEILVRLRMARPFANVVVDNSNNGNPRYEFSTRGISAKSDDRNTAVSALDIIRAVPNPYYGASYYEDSQLDNIVKITNLPAKCDITIYGTNGTQIRKIRKDNALTFVEWDLRNDYNVPIASGVYIIHIDAGDLGEKVIKWFGSMRPVDLNAF